MKPMRPLAFVLVLVAAMAAGCAPEARRMLTIASSPTILEGERAQVNVAVQNIFPHPILPLTLTLYTRPEPTEYSVLREVIAEENYYRPLQATEVHYLGTLDCIQADHVRDGATWRRVPDSRYLHPRILLPGRTLSETFQFQAHEPHRRLLYCDLYYLPLVGVEAHRLFARDKSRLVPPDAERYREVFTRIPDGKLEDPDPQPENYLFFRPRAASARPLRLVTVQVPLRVRPRTFTYRDAARRARFGARGHCYFTAARAWVFEYPDGGTWIVGPVATTKLNGQYLDLVADLELRSARTLDLSAPRKPDDKFLQLLQMLGHSDPKATPATAEASIPAENLPSVLEQAEALGYTVEARTWRPIR